VIKITLRSIARTTTCAVLFGFAASSMAATITVNSLDDDIDDDGNCTLREAITAANGNSTSGAMPGECQAGDATPTVDEIVFAASVSGTIAIASKLPPVDEDVFINGPGADLLAIDATNVVSGNVEILTVSGGTFGTTIAGLTFQNTVGTGSSALDVESPTTIQNCIFQDNESNGGGAINALDDLTIENCVFRRNTANLFEGGAVSFRDTNRNLIIRDSYFDDNQTLGSFRAGGAVHVAGLGHQTFISGSTFADNLAAGNGGAISIGGALLEIENTTFTGNSAIRDGGAIETGVMTTLANVTMAGNLADSDANNGGDGGGIARTVSSAEITVRNTIIADNMDASPASGFAPDCTGAFISDGHNLIGQVNVACLGFTDGVNNDQVGTGMNPIDPMLDALADNGGPTPTMALQAASPAVAGGNPMGCDGADGMALNVDQRGEPRPAPAGSACDMGAFELDQPLPTFNLTVSVIGNGAGRVSSNPSAINCPFVVCSAEFDEGTVVTLTSQQASGSVFVEWSGDCSGSGACQVTMDQMRNVTAEFALDEQLLEVEVTGDGSVTSSPVGIDCPGDCTESYLTGTVVTLDAVADSGSQFDGWSGACSGTGACQVTMDQMQSVSAEFTEPGFILQVNIGGNGSGVVTSAPVGINCPNDCSEAFDEGQSVSLLPSPDAGFFFQNWAGDCIGGGLCDLTMDDEKLGIAVFRDEDTLFLDSFE